LKAAAEEIPLLPTCHICAPIWPPLLVNGIDDVLPTIKRFPVKVRDVLMVLGGRTIHHVPSERSRPTSGEKQANICSRTTRVIVGDLLRGDAIG